MIQVEHLSKDYGPVMAVDNVSFEVGKGEIVGFLGRNGAGKSTTIRVLTTYLPATTGTARVAGYDVRNQSMEVRQQIGYLPESVPMYPEMRVEEYLEYRARLKGVDRAMRAARIDEAMNRCKVREVRRRLIGTLSRGYRQRVGLADTLTHNPPILFMDEPTSGLDPLQIDETLQTIKSLAEKHTILFSTHILSEVEKVCQRVLIIHKGKLLADGSLVDLTRDDSQVVVVEVRGPADQVSAALQHIEGVARVTQVSAEGSWISFEVRLSGKADPREAIFHKIAKGGWALRRLDLRRRKLDEYFTSLVRKADGDLQGV